MRAQITPATSSPYPGCRTGSSLRAETLEDVAFLSGAALSLLHLVLSHDDVPHMIWRGRLALRAGEACVALSGRPERAGALRDALHFLRPGDLRGPAGETCLAWQRATERPVSIKALSRALPALAPSQIAMWLDVGRGHLSVERQWCLRRCRRRPRARMCRG